MRVVVIIVVLAGIFFACKKDPPLDDTPIFNYNPTPYILEVSSEFPNMDILEENPLTKEGVQLGRMLYYDSILDPNLKISCSTCHIQKQSFTSAPTVLPHINIGYNKAFLWNGKVEGGMEAVMLFEVEDFMQTDVSKLNQHKEYQRLFREAFNAEQITSKEIAYALAQFIRTLVSDKAKFDRIVSGDEDFTDAEYRGFEIFMTEKGDCFHCHGSILFTDLGFHNNGLDSDPESGRYAVTEKAVDRGKFKTPTLRNIEFTGPYMHDGRYNTLEEVIDFYSEGLQFSETIDPLMKNVQQGGVQLTTQEKSDLLAFLKTLTDTSYLNNPNFSKPF